MDGERGVGRTVLGQLRALWQPLFLTHVAWTALGVILIAPLLGLMTRLLLALSGETAVADADIARFALTPLGLGSILLVAAFFVTIVVLELASLMRIAAGARHEQAVGTIGAMRFALVRAPRIIAFALRLLVRVLLLAAPFLAAGGAVAWYVLRDHDINYYLAERPPAFWVAGGVVGLLLLAMLLLLTRKLLAWSLALPLVLFTRAGTREAFLESEGITQGRGRRILVTFAWWAILAFLFSVLLFGLIHMLGSVLVPGARDSIKATLLVLGLLALLLTLGNLLVTGVSGALFALLSLEFFERYGPGMTAAALGSAPPRESIPGWRLTGPRFVLGLVFAAFLALLLGAWLLQGVRAVDDVEIIAHRGAAGAAPENTLASVKRAIQDGTDWVEIDVQETKDGRVVVLHDSDFMKLAGVDLKIWDATFEQARAIDVGSRFSPTFKDERVPTLEEVLDAARDQAGVVIELKYYGHDQDLEQRVVDIVEQVQMVDQIQLMSLEYDAVGKLRKLRPTWRVGLLAATAIGDLTTRESDFLAVSQGMVTSAFLRRAHRAGKQVYAWTVNDAVTMSRLISLGVDGLITDEPALARQVLADRAEMSATERLLLHAAVLFDQDVPLKTYRDESP